MSNKMSSRNRLRKNSEIPTPARIVQERNSIQSTWSQQERKRRRIDSAHQTADVRFQAHLRFIQFLIEHESK